MIRNAFVPLDRVKYPTGCSLIDGSRRLKISQLQFEAGNCLFYHIYPFRSCEMPNWMIDKIWKKKTKVERQCT